MCDISYFLVGLIVFLIVQSPLRVTSQGISLQACCPYQQYLINGTCAQSENNTEDFNYYLSSEDLNLKPDLPQTITFNVTLRQFQCRDGTIPVFKSILKYTTLTSSVEGCVDRGEDNSLNFYECEPKCNLMAREGGPLCHAKCCALGQLMSITEEKLGCVEAGNLKWFPTIYKEVRTVSSKSPKIQWIHTPPRTLCTQGFFYFHRPYLYFPKTLFRIMEDGRVIHKDRSHWLEIPKGSYCLEGILPPNGSTESSNLDELVYGCLEESGMDEEIYEGFTNSVEYKLGIIIGCYISALFVFLTIVVYLLLWEIQNIHGWTLLCSFVSLFSLYVHLGFMQGYHVIWGTDANNRNILCWTIGVGLHFSYLSFFSWASVVNFDLWYSFRNLRAVNQKKRRLGRFLKYAMAGFGIPLSIIGLSLSFDHIYRTDELAEYIFPDPDYGSDKCFLARNESPVAYWLGPIGTLLTVNVIFIVVTITSVYKAQKSASMAVNSSSRRHKQSLELFGKLLVVMGVLWVFDIISFVFSRDFVPWYFAIFDVINVCHGIFIFIIFICKKSTLHSLETKYALIARASATSCKWWKQIRGFWSYLPNKIHTVFTQTSRRVSAQSRFSTQSDHPTELSAVGHSAGG